MRRSTAVLADILYDLTSEHLRRGATQDLRDRWRMIWYTHVEEDKLHTTDVDDVGLISSLGWMIAMEDGKYEFAKDLLRSYFSHPQIERANVHYRTYLRSCLATTLLFAGDEAEAISIYNSLMDRAESSVRQSAQLSVRNHLLGFLGEHRETEVASESLINLVNKLACQLRRRRSAGAEQSSSKTYGDLLTILASTASDQQRTRRRRAK